MRVLEINVDDIGMGGVFSLVRSLIFCCDNSISIDIAAIEPFEQEENKKKLESLGSNIYYIGYTKSKLIKQIVCFIKLFKLIKKQKYSTVHIHADVANKLLVSGLACKIAGVNKILLHSHASDVDGNKRLLKKIYHKCCCRFLKYIATDFLSCSDLAASWMFPNIKSSKIKIIKNGVNLEKFRFNQETRLAYRQLLNCDSNFIIGHVGRFAYQKNHSYIIHIFNSVKKEIPSAKLLLIGEGVMENEIKQKVRDLGLSDDVIFYGTTPHIPEMMAAMDIFILPSHFEGLPIVGVEAQASGLPVIFSDKISRDSKVTENVDFLPINPESISSWVEKIKDFSKKERVDTYSTMLSKGFSIKQTADDLFELYRR